MNDIDYVYIRACAEYAQKQIDLFRLEEAKKLLDNIIAETRKPKVQPQWEESR